MWRVSSFMFFYRAFGDASHETWMSGDTPLHFFSDAWCASSDVKARHFLFCAEWWAEVKVAWKENEEKLKGCVVQ